jgi:hypothetical protein
MAGSSRYKLSTGRGGRDAGRFSQDSRRRNTGLRRDLTRYLHDYNHDREHHGRKTAGRCPADLLYGAHRMEPR